MAGKESSFTPALVDAAAKAVERVDAQVAKIDRKIENLQKAKANLLAGRPAAAEAAANKLARQIRAGGIKIDVPTAILTALPK